jgi:hypothetical protein
LLAGAAWFELQCGHNMVPLPAVLCLLVAAASPVTAGEWVDAGTDHKLSTAANTAASRFFGSGSSSKPQGSGQEEQQQQYGLQPAMGGTSDW